MERFDIYAEKNGVGESPEEAAEETANNGHQDDGDSASGVPSPPPSSSPVKRQVESEEASDPSESSPPPKKLKPDADVDADALFAAKLQAEENLRARPTRGGNTRRAAPAKKKSKAKAKTSKRVKAEDDSDVESGSDTKKEVNRTGGFHVRAVHVRCSYIPLTYCRNLSISHPLYLRSWARLRYVLFHDNEIWPSADMTYSCRDLKR